MAKQYERLLKGVMSQALGSGRMGGKYVESKIRRIWQQNMGETIQSYTKEIRFFKNTLYITIISAPLRSELNMGKSKIIKLMNEELGQEHVKEVVIQ